ncbi:zinc-regulated transporter 2 [Pseudomassariella vexata]|uniref:Zinc-regulated transporter 2 n=1 Tax=Pseudomassariella vexata TaxID=1141098 RepID=A0A1Y2DTX1_9PEZI|nr:zinc-regulated transporter 2 [Pseudomassariella vexata]ORY62619.1 zinc-regulated transporter 2 [Pseudomassariella vexata]
MSDSTVNVKPQCGSGDQVGEYDLGLHVAGLFMVLAASIFGAGFPVAAKKIKWLKVPEKVFFACKHFGTGVLIATAFVHLLPTAFFSLSDPCLPDLFTEQYPPMPGVIMMASLFSLFTIEMWLNSKMGGHSHGGAKGFESSPSAKTMAQMGGQMREHMGPAGNFSRPLRHTRTSLETDDDISYEKKVAQKAYEENATIQRQNPYADSSSNELDFAHSEMPPWFIVFYEQYVRQHLEMMKMIKESGGRYHEDSESEPVVSENQAPIFDEEGQQVDPAVLKKMSLNITLLEGGILFHSVFVGMTISITIEGFIILLIAILFHQMFEGLGLGSRIAAVPYAKGSIRPWVLVVAFGTTAPIGQAIGLITRNAYDPNSAFGLIIVGVFNAISAGLLIYASTVDLLAEDFLSEEANETLSEKEKITAFCYVLAGATGMSIVGAFA